MKRIVAIATLLAAVLMPSPARAQTFDLTGSPDPARAGTWTCNCADDTCAIAACKRLPPAEPPPPLVAVEPALTGCMSRPAANVRRPTLPPTAANVLNADKPGLVFDLRGSPLIANSPVVYPLLFRDPAPDLCVTGLSVVGAQAETTTWRDMKANRDGDGVLTRFAKGSVTIEKSSFANIEDAISPRSVGGTPWTVRRVYARHIRDDFIENDQCLPGQIEDVLVDGTFIFLSSRPGAASGGRCAAAYPLVVRRALVRMSLQPYGTDMGGAPAAGGSLVNGKGHGQIWKTGAGMGPVDVEDSTFVLEGASVNGRGSMAWPAGTYRRVTLVWLGEGHYPGPTLPQGVTLTTDRSSWDRSRDEWLRAHGCTATATPKCSFNRG